MLALFGKLALGAGGMLKGFGGMLGRFFHALNAQGIAGLAGCLALAVLLIMQKGETRHWKKQSAGFERLYHNEHAAFAQTVASYRAAAERARAADQANAARVGREQAAISERTSHDYETRLADARARYAASLRGVAQGPAHPGGGGAAPVPGLSAAPGGPAEAAGEGGLSAQDQLTATEQAIQLDELIKWTLRQHAVDVNAARSASPTEASGNADQPPH